MTKKLPVSVFIIAYNESDRIGRAISSVIDWVDEVIVIDSGSQDDTVSVSQAAGARVVETSWLGYGLQKRFAEDHCRNPWALNIDADESISDPLRQEIQALFEKGPPEGIYGYPIHCVTVLPPFAKTRHPFYPKITCIRLYHRAYGRFSTHPVHDSVVIDPLYKAPHPLKGVIDHYTIRNLSDITKKFNTYSDAQIETMTAPPKGIKEFFLKIRLVFEFFLNFLKFYILRRFFVHGFYGFLLAMTYAFARFQRLAKVYEKGLKLRHIQESKKR